MNTTDKEEQWNFGGSSLHWNSLRLYSLRGVELRLSRHTPRRPSGRRRPSSSLWYRFLMIIPVACQSVYFETETFCLERFFDDVKNVLVNFGIYFGLPIYILARLVLLSEAMIALRNLSSGALLEVQWTSFLPHI